MEHRKLGESSLELPVITFGAWAIGGLFWGGTDDQEAMAAIRASIDQGVDAIDTAPIYGRGHSETVVGRAIRGIRDKVRILTKCGIRWDGPGQHHFTIKSPEGDEVAARRNAKADSVIYECEQSLQRLGIDCIDLYQVHTPDTTTPAEETMGALLRLKEQGKIREIGVSNYSGQQMRDALGHAAVASNQIRYNLLERGIESDALPFCREHRIGVIAFSPMAMGLLTGKVTLERQFPETDVRSRKELFLPDSRRRALAALERIGPIARRHGCTLGQLAVAWVIAQPGVTTALVGARNAQQAVENAAAARVRLTAQELDEIRRAFE